MEGEAKSGNANVMLGFVEGTSHTFNNSGELPVGCDHLAGFANDWRLSLGWAFLVVDAV